MDLLRQCFCLCFVIKLAVSAPASGFVFPDERRDRKIEPVITPPVLPYIEHLERDPSTLTESERQQPSLADRSSSNEIRGGRYQNSKEISPPTLPILEHLERDPSTLTPSASQQRDRIVPRTQNRNENINRNENRNGNPRFGFGGSYNVAPSGNGGLTASLSSSANGAGASHSASQSFSFGFNQGFSASHSASQSSSFNGVYSGFSGSQASSQAASFAGNGGSLSGASSSAAAFGGGGGSGSGSQSASSAFGFNSIPVTPYDEVNFGEGLLDVRHRGAPNFPFPGRNGRGRSVGAAAIRSAGGDRRPSAPDDWLAIIVSD